MPDLVARRESGLLMSSSLRIPGQQSGMTIGSWWGRVREERGVPGEGAPAPLLYVEAARKGIRMTAAFRNELAAVGPVGSAAGAWRVALSRKGHTGDA